MRKMYKQPKIDIASVEMAMNICRVSGDGRVKVNNTEELTGIKIY